MPVPERGHMSRLTFYRAVEKAEKEREREGGSL
jgi:hypothetical protein